MTERFQNRGEEEGDSDDSLFGASSKATDDNLFSPRRKNSILSYNDDAENQYFGKSENRKVQNLKTVVFLVLFLVTLAVCLVIYFLTRQGQQDEFEAS